MQMHEHFEDVRQLIREQSCVAELIAIEAMHLTERVTGKAKEIHGDLLQTLTTLVVRNMNYDEVKSEFRQRAHQREINRQIDEAVQRTPSNNMHFTGR